MPISRTAKPIPIASRVNNFSYAIRNIVAEAQAVEARGKRVRYLNIGDPVAAGFKTPPHLIEAAERAMRDGHNGYLPSAGIAPAREAIAADYTARSVPTTADRVLITTGTSEGIGLVLNALVGEGEEVLVPLPTYPLYTAVIANIGAQARYYRTDPQRDWQPDIEHLRSLITPRTRVLVTIDPNNPTGAVYSQAVRRALLEIADEHGLTILADEVYGDLGFDGPVPLLGSLDRDAAIISLSSLSKAYLAPGWRTGWLVVSATPRLDDALVALKKLADGRLCSPGPMQYAVAAALTGDRSHQVSFRKALAERARLTTDSLNAIPGMRCVAPRAAFYAMPMLSLPPGRTDEDYVLALLRETGILVVYGSGFGMPAELGSFRIVYLPDPSELRPIYADIAAFTRQYLQQA
jgi:alanine-synthesizing transaminase